MADALEAKFPGRVLLIRYEDLSTSTEAMTRSMLNFLDLPWTKEMSSFIETHTRGGNFCLVVIVRIWVKELSWLLIGCLKTKNQ